MFNYYGNPIKHLEILNGINDLKKDLTAVNYGIVRLFLFNLWRIDFQYVKFFSERQRHFQHKNLHFS